MAIPKVIHYVWVGPRPLPASAQKCLCGWKELMPDYEIKLWDEKTSPMDHQYVKAMYVKQKWAFVSDYIRFFALHTEGGIYLDTDMEVLKPLDAFLNNHAFLGKTKDGYTACGIIGAEAGHPFIKSALDFYDNDRSHSIENTSPRVVTRLLAAGNFPDVKAYEPEVFYPCNDGERCTPDMLERAYATHHWAETWVPFAGLRKALRRFGIMPFVKRLLK